MLKIFRPVKTDQIDQKFGENKACVNDNGKVLTKVGGICPAGYKDLYLSLGMKGHNGVDWRCSNGDPIYHSGNFKGLVDTLDDEKGGIGIDIYSLEPMEVKKGAVKMKVFLRYYHLQKIAVADRSIVNPGDLIGWGDTTGYASGPHLHLTMKFYKGEAPYKSETLNGNNGYLGAVNPQSWFINKFIRDIMAELDTKPIEPKPIATVPSSTLEMEDEIIKIHLSFIDILKKFISILQQKLKDRFKGREV